ncbi:MAG: AAA domain-containing protein, partial [Candidatus Hodarchaeota archaeon]
MLNSIQEKLIDLVDYVGHMIRLGEKPVFALADYHQLLFHEAHLKDRIGIEHDKTDDNGVVWIKIQRLKRIDPPEIPEGIRSWITVGNDPFNQPSVQTVRSETISEEKAREYVKLGMLDKSDIQPALKTSGSNVQCDVIFRLDKLPDVKKRVDDYIRGPWTRWSEEEKPRRKTIRIYEAFFSLQQTIQSQGPENALELVWGIGLIRWNKDGYLVDHALVEQLVEIEIDSGDGSIAIRPRGTEPQLALKPFFALDNPGAETVLNFAREFFPNFSEDEELSPFLPDTFTPVLRQAASHLDKSGQYYPDVTDDVTDRTLPPVSDTLTVTDTWAIYARQRSDNFFLNDLECLKEAIRSTEELPGPCGRLVTEPSEETRHKGGFLDLGKASLTGYGTNTGNPPAPADALDATQTHEFFFPKAFNEEQISIIRELEKTDGVVVQGPPGTGKTHTIANIICHCLATGKRVLVTSKAEAALTVLREHIPKEIRELTISLLANERQGLKQLERAVNLLASTATQMKPKELERDILSGQERILELRRKIDEIDTELREWASRHLKRIGTKGDNLGILPIELAERVMADKARHSWLPDRPGADKKFNPRFTDKDISSVRSARKALGKDLQYIDKTLPSIGDLPDVASLVAIHHDLVNAERLEHQTNAQNIPILSVAVPDAFERTKKVLTVIKEIIRFLKAIEDLPWLQNIFNIWQVE